MSNPVNPLSKFNTFSVKHILVAFKYTEDAENTNISPTIGDIGEEVKGFNNKGPGIVVINEFKESAFSVQSVRWSWDFYSPGYRTSTSMLGYLEVTDRTGLYFIDFLKSKVSSKLGLSEGHIVFCLKTYFIGNSEQDTMDNVIVGNNLIFNMVTFVNSLSDVGKFYTMSFVSPGNTMAQLNQYSRIYQMTITHKDGNLHKEIPQPQVASSGIKPRGAEDSLQNSARKTRIDKSKPMKTLKDIFQAFESELNEQKYPHNAQLQNWLQKVRDDYVFKINPPIQKKVGGIPMDFFISLDPLYDNYDVNNRNMPFEQPEQDQNKPGIRSITLDTGMDIVKAVERLMKLSKKVGQDAKLDKPFTFRTVVSVLKTPTNRYEIHVKITRVHIPINSNTVNTGPGEGAIAPLEFFYQDPQFDDNDIFSIESKIGADVGLSMLEKQSDAPNANIVFGDREQATAERVPEFDFFKAQYSGLRPMINPYENGGLESAEDAGKVDNSLKVELTQSTIYKLSIRGNPYLMSDLSRKPSEIINGKVGSANYYKLPEVNPMYVKLNIYLKPQAVLGLDDNDEVSQVFYLQNYLHLFKVVNVFDGEKFYQELYLLRSDGTL